ncbi:MAG TPA: hypothetical protein VNM66_00825 [Thermodesulfobacteriota bacterium]|nr:hypothetical protein [Thermodesulfobacteriota bacterium]
MTGRRISTAGLAALLLVAGAVPPAAAQRPGPGGLVDPRAPVVVALLPFRVNGPAELGYLGQAIADLLATRLVTLAPAEQGAVAAAIARRGGEALSEAAAREIGRESGAQFVVLGTVTAIGNRLSLDARILPVTSGRAATIYVQGEGLDELFTHVGSLALEIDKGISGLGAFVGTEPGGQSPPAGPRSSGVPSQGAPLDPARGYRGRVF